MNKQKLLIRKKKGSLLRKLVLAWTPSKGKGSGRSLTSYYRGGFTPFYYNIDYKYANYGKNSTQAVILEIIYLQFKYIFVGLILYLNGKLKGSQNIIIISKQNKAGDLISFGDNVPNTEGNSKPIYSIPIGSYIYNIEIYPNKGSSLIRSKGTYGQLLHIKNKYAYILLPSKEIKIILKKCFCSLGVILSSTIKKKIKAGYNKIIGKRPRVRGVAMNAADHAHGGGSGKSSIKKAISYSRWGVPNKGKKTVKLTKKQSLLKKSNITI